VYQWAVAPVVSTMTAPAGASAPELGCPQVEVEFDVEVEFVGDVVFVGVVAWKPPNWTCCLKKSSDQWTSWKAEQRSSRHPRLVWSRCLSSTDNDILSIEIDVRRAIRVDILRASEGPMEV
jgi:hypothetical protein